MNPLQYSYNSGQKLTYTKRHFGYAIKETLYLNHYGGNIAFKCYENNFLIPASCTGHTVTLNDNTKAVTAAFRYQDHPSS